MTLTPPRSGGGGAGAVAAPAPRRSSLLERSWPLVLILAVELAFLAVVWRLAVSYAPPGGALALDALAAPGAEARIGLALERENPFFPGHSLAGARVIFEAAVRGSPGAWAPAGTATSDANGVALLAVRAPETPGFHLHRAGIDPTSDARAAGMEAEIILHVEPVDRPLVFVVLPPAPGADPLFARTGGKAEPSAPSRAAAALREIAASRAIVYIASRTDGARALRPWLDREGFPKAAVLFAAADASPAGAILAGLDPARPRAKVWGIASTSADAAAFALARLRVVLLRGAREGVEGSHIVPAAGWPEVVRIING
jgi:hypothetical protein